MSVCLFVSNFLCTILHQSSPSYTRMLSASGIEIIFFYIFRLKVARDIHSSAICINVYFISALFQNSIKFIICSAYCNQHLSLKYPIKSCSRVLCSRSAFQFIMSHFIIKHLIYIYIYYIAVLLRSFFVFLLNKETKLLKM